MLRSKKILPIILAVVMLIVDQISKIAVKLWLPKPPQMTVVIPHIIDFQYVENPGAAFGMLSEHRWVFMFLTTVTLIFCIYIFFFKNTRSLILNYSLMLIISGGIGNMIDRIFRGIVIDFINFTFMEFAVFNVADCCVVIGGCLLILYMIIDMINDAKSRKIGE
ncbi:MAG: signal peptidase II [Clostridia bacterium]|nr:signal peptidase II [Clostridia bacterium]